jgi:hypothetical protein
MKATARGEFERLAKEFLTVHPELRHEWRPIASKAFGDRLDLVFPGTGANAEVWATAYTDQIAVGAGSDGDHNDFQDFGRGETPSQLAREGFNRLKALLRQHGHLGASLRTLQRWESAEFDSWELPVSMRSGTLFARLLRAVDLFIPAGGEMQIVTPLGDKFESLLREESGLRPRRRWYQLGAGTFVFSHDGRRATRFAERIESLGEGGAVFLRVHRSPGGALQLDVEDGTDELHFGRDIPRERQEQLARFVAVESVDWVLAPSA